MVNDSADLMSRLPAGGHSMSAGHVWVANNAFLQLLVARVISLPDLKLLWLSNFQ